MKKVLITTAILEAATGLAMLAFPSFVAFLMLGSPLNTAAALALSRIAGVALLALGVACWLARHDEQARAAKGIISAMVLYNAGVIAVLVYGALFMGVSGIALWPTVMIHATLGGWCITSLRAKHT
jgi:hypothetical protein